MPVQTSRKTRRIFVGVDPGFIDPCVAILNGDREPIFYKPDTKNLKSHDDYLRAFEIGVMMAEFVRKKFPGAEIVLGIEGASFGSHSSSVEQLANCRQAIFDTFKTICHLIDWYRVAPTTAKKFMTGDGRADKSVMVLFAKERAPKAISDKLADRIQIAMADALAIALVTKEKWNGQTHKEG
jgi:Holliday junction resolvasome RuvABC endonuclease subunit